MILVIDYNVIIVAHLFSFQPCFRRRTILFDKSRGINVSRKMKGNHELKIRANFYKQYIRKNFIFPQYSFEYLSKEESIKINFQNIKREDRSPRMFQHPKKNPFSRIATFLRLAGFPIPAKSSHFYVMGLQASPWV